jgi:CHASE2 domain-containing sensor protein
VLPRRPTRWAHYHRAIVAVAAGFLAAAAGLVLGSEMNPLDGTVYDLSLAVTDSRPGNRDEPVAVIALDRDSLDSDELQAMPRVFLSPVWAKLVDALTVIKARAIGFDIIFSYSANRFPGFAGHTTTISWQRSLGRATRW